jgi:SDR family mycofactocin-dependent oxidoreductase
MSRLEGKVAFVTGGARGQGRSHAVRLAAEGADIILVDICSNIPTNRYDLATPDDLAETVRLVEEHDRRAIAAQADVRDYARLKEVLAGAVAELGRLDIVLANAGIAPMSEDEDDEIAGAVFQTVIDVNLVGVWNTCRVSIPHLVAGGRGGAMVLTSSTAGIRGIASGSSGANALAPESIRVNTIHPTGVNTPMVVNPVMQAWLESKPDRSSAMTNPMPVELLEAEDISNTVAFLVSDEAKYITGVMLPVDAGFCNQ